MTVILHQHHNHPLEMPVDSKDLSTTNGDIIKSLETSEVADSKERLSAIKKHNIISSLNALEIQLQKSSEAVKSCAENTAERRNHPEFQSYQELLESLFPAKSAQEENELEFLLPPEKHPFNFDVDIGSFIDYYRATYKTDKSEMVWIWPRRGIHEPVDMKMLPHNPMQEIINQALEKLRNLEEAKETSEIL